MMGSIKIQDAAVEYILYQRTAYIRTPMKVQYLCRFSDKLLPFSIYNNLMKIEAYLGKNQIKKLYESDMNKEYDSFKEYLPAKCSSVLDIGCGVAGIDILIQQHFKNTNIYFYLLDKTKIDKRIHYGFKRLGSFYNSLCVARDLLMLNGIAEKNIKLLEANEENEIDIDVKIDLVISLISWGYHYPLDVYFNAVYKLVSKTGKLIIDLRKDTNGIQKLKDNFNTVIILNEYEKHFRVLCENRF